MTRRWPFFCPSFVIKIRGNGDIAYLIGVAHNVRRA